MAYVLFAEARILQHWFLSRGLLVVRVLVLMRVHAHTHTHRVDGAELKTPGEARRLGLGSVARISHSETGLLHAVLEAHRHEGPTSLGGGLSVDLLSKLSDFPKRLCFYG